MHRRRFLQAGAVAIGSLWWGGCSEIDTSEELRTRFLENVKLLPDLEGDIPSFSIYSRTALVVNVWASWCPPCVIEMPSLQKLGELFHPRDLRVIGVSVDSDLNLVREFLIRTKPSFPILLDQGNKVLRVPTFPSTFLLRRDHTIAKIVVGEQDWASEKLVEEIERLLFIRRANSNQTP